MRCAPFYNLILGLAWITRHDDSPVELCEGSFQHANKALLLWGLTEELWLVLACDVSHNRWESCELDVTVDKKGQLHEVQAQ